MDLDKLDNIDTTELDNAPDLEDLVYEDPENNGSSSDTIDDNNTDINDDTKHTDDEDNIEEPTNEEGNDNDDYNEDEIVKTKEPKSKILIDFGEGKVEANDIDELKTIASKALKDKTRFDKYKEELAILEGIKEQGLSDKDLYLLVEAKKGNKQAISKLLKESNIDPYELDLEDESIDEYKPNEYKVDPKIMEVKSIIEDAKSDDNTFKTFNYILNNEFNESDRAKAFEDPNLLAFIKDTVKTGVFDAIAPNYTKRKIMGENPISAYINAYDDYMKELEKQKETTVNKIKEENQQKATKRKKASEGTKKVVSNKKQKSIDDMTDEEFEKYYKSIVGDF